MGSFTSASPSSTDATARIPLISTRPLSARRSPSTPTPAPALVPPATVLPPGPAPSAAPVFSPANVGPAAPTPTRDSLPQLQIINKKQVKLGFDVSQFGPSGLGSVEIYVTADEG